MWFHARRYGWGWTPVAVQGWLVVAVFLVAVVIDVVVFVYRTRTGADVHPATIAFVLALALVAAVLVTILLDDRRTTAPAVGKSANLC